MINMPQKKKTLFHITEAKGEPFSVTLKSDKDSLEDETTNAYVMSNEKTPLIHLVHMDTPERVERLVPIISHESLHLTMHKINERKASRALDIAHGYSPDFTNAGISNKKNKHIFPRWFLF